MLTTKATTIEIPIANQVASKRVEKSKRSKNPNTMLNIIKRMICKNFIKLYKNNSSVCIFGGSQIFTKK